MKRKSRPYAPDLREDWQVAQGLHCPCGGFDEMCVCQNVDEPWRYGRGGKPPSAQQDLEQRIRELEGTVRTLELQQQTDRQTIASLLAARPAVVSDEVVERMCRAHHETRRPAHETPAGGLTRWATWAEVCEVEDERDRRLAAMRSALALLPGGVPDGYMLVPREPTEAMIKSGQGAADDKYWLWRGLGERPVGSGLDGMALYVDAAYRAMLSASPKEVSHER